MSTLDISQSESRSYNTEWNTFKSYDIIYAVQSILPFPEIVMASRNCKHCRCLISIKYIIISGFTLNIQQIIIITLLNLNCL